MKVSAKQRLLQTHTHTENKWLWCLLMEHDKEENMLKLILNKNDFKSMKKKKKLCSKICKGKCHQHATTHTDFCP